MNTLRKILLLACTAVIVGCKGVSPKPDHVAVTKQLGDGTYEIQLRYSETYSGGPCLTKDWFKTRTSYTTIWFYVKAPVGTIATDRLTVATDPVKRQWPYVMTNLHGTVSFTNGTMIVRLKQPNVDSHGREMSRYVPFYLNGTYQIREQAQ